MSPCEPLDLAHDRPRGHRNAAGRCSRAAGTSSRSTSREPLVVDGDPVRLTQVFANLLNNAAKYTNPGGHIWIDARREHGEAVVSVRDNGIGIAPDAPLGGLRHVHAGESLDRRTQGGLGIGLTLVRSLVSACTAARVEARSEGRGCGSEFVVRLPLVLDRQACASRSRASLGSLPDCRVLIVDDNRDAGDTLGHAAELAACDGRVRFTAVRKRWRRSTSSIPKSCCSTSACRAWTAMKSRAASGRGVASSVRLIALTGWGQEEDLRRAERAGFDHHLVKPPDLEKLGRLLTDVHTAGRA